MKLSLSGVSWQRDLVLPLAGLFGPVLLSIISYGEFLNLMLPVALILGYIVRPARLWLIWIGSIVLVWVSYGFATLVGTLPEPGTDQNGETVGSFMVEVVIFMAVLVLLPLWIGRLVGTHVQHGRGAEKHA
jgi:hypothetical protein